MLVTQDEVTPLKSGSKYLFGELTKQHVKLPYMKQGTVVGLFDGVDTMLDFITDELTKHPKGDSSITTNRASFNAFPDYKTAMNTFRNHPEQVVKYEPSELRIKDESEAGSQVEYDVTGDYIDMGRYMEGVPESMGTMHNGNARNRRVNILLNLNQSFGISHEVITHRGERVVRLVDALEAGGVRCNITAIESSQCNHVEVIVKQHSEPLSVNDLAVATHPEFLRRAIFRIIEQSKTFKNSYGSAVEFGDTLTPELADSGTNDELDIILDGNFHSASNIDAMFDKLERLLVWEMSKPVPEVTSVKVDRQGLFFNPNGYRSEAEIRREGNEVLDAE